MATSHKMLDRFVLFGSGRIYFSFFPSSNYNSYIIIHTYCPIVFKRRRGNEQFYEIRPRDAGERILRTHPTHKCRIPKKDLRPEWVHSWCCSSRDTYFPGRMPPSVWRFSVKRSRSRCENICPRRRRRRALQYLQTSA